MLLELGTPWMARWQEGALKRSGLFSYRRAIGRVALFESLRRG
jgi:hypothetical protein